MIGVMNPWAKLLLISLPLAIALTATFRFIQHTDDEYSFWVEISAETAALVEARCVAIRSAATRGSPRMAGRRRSPGRNPAPRPRSPYPRTIASPPQFERRQKPRLCPRTSACTAAGSPE